MIRFKEAQTIFTLQFFVRISGIAGQIPVPALKLPIAVEQKENPWDGFKIFIGGLLFRTELFPDIN
ncbi:MAG: hypothetical protein JXX14_03475 [Deltaproteobacteria bacterium]|nr:hypothetical protein [Deltaproteobacteria bacterium]